MTSKTLSKAILTAIVLVTIVGCAPTPESAENTPTPESPQVENKNLCDNPLFPVVQGATWTYASTGTPSLTEPYTFTDTISEVREDGFTLTSQFPGLTRQQEWSCTLEGLVALQLGSGTAGGLSTSQMNLELTTSNVTGVTIPAVLTTGQTWTYGFDLKGDMDIAGNPASAEGNLSSTLNAIGMESVTVPAGTFDAMKIQVATGMDIQATFEGLSMPIPFTATSFIWFVPGVGWVKLENSGNLGGTEITETITLQSFSIPD